MPRISDTFLQCVIYLYPNVQAAEAGEHFGGSGFIVGVPSEVDPVYYCYAVTNSHVIREADSPIVRLNTQEDNMGVVKLSEGDWIHHPDGDDLAIAPLAVPSAHFKFKFVSTGDFLTKERIEQHDVGPGDDTFMVGRFVNHEGTQRNPPSVRFGNIAMMPWEPIKNARGILQESFLNEMRSLSGYSGSPVFVYIPGMAIRPNSAGWHSGAGPWLLGIDWGHLQQYESVLEKNGDIVQEGWKVKSNSGMSTVIPVSRLEQLLNIEEFVKQRKMLDKQRSTGIK